MVDAVLESAIDDPHSYAYRWAAHEQKVTAANQRLDAYCEAMRDEINAEKAKPSPDFGVIQEKEQALKAAEWIYFD